MINETIAKLVRYSQLHNLTAIEDEVCIVNALMDALGMTEFTFPSSVGDGMTADDIDLEAILGTLCD